eukprot:Gregarina_sp_Poly_1__9027@NODE_550_length_7561_cov_218_532826_g435_i0_p3_GENE_NODE_550_length_7561_cov_218_532826_g435_i0NODE_550_length_7561_cov_218_532826_g435_i0_p3_ORF_typecomplete_len391_score56_36Glyco_transf_25/PF01755_17/5_1e17_NODE_550_length_7561_cov_218_532826_g435_i023183490
MFGHKVARRSGVPLVILILLGSISISAIWLLIGRLLAEPPPAVATLQNQGAWSLPMYYINMKDDVERDSYMQTVFGSRGTTLKRVPAVKTTDMEVLLQNLDPGDIPDRERLLREKHYETFRLFKALPGQIGNFISHMRAIKQAYDDGHELVLIAEDDVGDATLGLWPFADPIMLADLASHQFSNKWSAIRLQWNDYLWSVREKRQLWFSDMIRLEQKLGKQEMIKLGSSQMSTGSFPFLPSLPLLTPLPQGWGNVCTLFNRRGLKKLLDLHLAPNENLPVPRIRGAQNESLALLWRCSKEFACQADTTFWHELGNESLATTPPWLTYRLAEVQTAAIRQGEVGKDHKKLHLNSVAGTMEWLMQLQEFFRPGGGSVNIPANLSWSVFNLNA